MSKPSDAADSLPVAAKKSLQSLGENLAIARQRRKESLKSWALRMNISVPTLMRMEKGDPSVGMGVYTTALWMIGRHTALPDLADPKEDLGALDMAIKAATSRYSQGGK